MKKENKELARKNKAAAKKRENTKNLIKGIMAITIPLVVFVVLFLVLIVFEKTDDEAENNDTVVTTEAETKLLKDKTLAVKDGDLVNIDYVGYIDDKPFEGGDTKGNGTNLLIGSHSYIDTFEQQLIGHKVGDNVDVNVKFPDDYSLNKDYAGKKALFKVVINGIYGEE